MVKQKSHYVVAEGALKMQEWKSRER